LAELALIGEKDKKKLQEAIKNNHSIEIALFGRMAADEPSLNAEASAQIAHCISTHEAFNEYDYYTAADDMKSREESTGAGMIGTVEFNSATLYRYATIAAHELHNQLSRNPQALSEAVREFARAFITSMPTGKQNTFANRTLPDALMVTIRKDQPINMAGAFEVPINASAYGGYIEASIKTLNQYAQRVYGSFTQEPYKTYVIGAGLEELGSKVNINTLLSILAEDIGSIFNESQ